jgi:uncharacterized membrane protein
VLSRFAFWPIFAGVVFLGIGIFVERKSLSTSRGWDKLLALRCIFYATPLAVFGAEHLVSAQGIMQVVPTWMPMRLFWTYLVGVALIAAAVSLTFRKNLRLSAGLLAIMFFLFVLLIHVPNVAAHLRERLYWAIALRDLTFAGGALALFATQQRRSSSLITIARMCIGLPLIVYGIEHFLHPEFAPGVPLSKLTPAWVPFPIALAWLTGAVLLVAGVAILLNKHSRNAATLAGLLMVLLTFLLYLPNLLMAAGTAQIVEGVNYVADTLLFGATILLLAEALPQIDRQSHHLGN